MRKIDITCQNKLLDEAGVCLPTVHPGAGPVACYELVDAVELGLSLTEKAHPPVGCFSRHFGFPQTDYRGPDHIVPGPGIVHWRDWAAWTGFRIQCPRRLAESSFVLKMVMATYRVGDPKSTLKPMTIRYEAELEEGVLGTVQPPGDESWRLVELAFDPGAFASGAMPEWLDLILDDKDNVPEDENHWGRRLSSLRLWAVSPAKHQTGRRQ